MTAALLPSNQLGRKGLMGSLHNGYSHWVIRLKIYVQIPEGARLTGESNKTSIMQYVKFDIPIVLMLRLPMGLTFCKQTF